jgi:hypothetical protein
MKKVNGEKAQEHYTHYDEDTGEVIAEFQPEYNTMSNGIGSSWYEKYKDDVYPHDFIVMNGKRMSPPRYYDEKYKTDYPYEYDELKEERLTKLEKHLDNNTPERLESREKVQQAKLDLLKRNLS